MNKTLLVTRHELGTILRKGSFLLLAFGVPLLLILIFAGVTIVKSRSAEDGQAAADTPQEYELEVEGYVDHSGLISVIPPDIPPGHLLAFADEEAAQGALASGVIAAYYIIPQDYMETDEIVYVYPDSLSLNPDGQAWLMLWTLLVNLLDGDLEQAGRVWNPMEVFVTNLTPESSGAAPGEEDCSRPGFSCESSLWARYLPAAMAALFFMFLMTSSTILLGSVSTEKENRTIEVLMLSVSPRQMLAGKIIGLGIASLFQTIAWVGAIFILMSIGGTTLNLPGEFAIPTSLLVWALVFFLLGYAVYASLMAGVGALAPKLKESNQASFLVMIPLMLGYMVGLVASMAGVSHGAIPTALSLFPLTAPIVMMMRLTEGGVPLWQLLLSAGLMLVTATLIVRVVAAMFHAQHLLSGQAFSVKRYFSVLLGRA